MVCQYGTGSRFIAAAVILVWDESVRMCWDAAEPRAPIDADCESCERDAPLPVGLSAAAAVGEKTLAQPVVVVRPGFDTGIPGGLVSVTLVR